MATQTQIVKKARFNPDIKRYILIYGILILFITIAGIPLILLWAPIAPLFIRKYFDRLECELTTRSLRFQKGLIFHTERTIPLDKIQDLTFKEGPLLKAFGLSVLKVETAGNSSQSKSDLTLIGIIDAADFRSSVLEQRDRVTENRAENSDGMDSLKGLLTEIRDSLNRIEGNLATQ